VTRIAVASHGTGSTPLPRRRAWYRGDCHVHTARSVGGELTPAQVAAAARAAGLDFIAVTEHNTTAAHDAWGPLAGDDLLVILGRETTTPTGHWLALGLENGPAVEGPDSTSAQPMTLPDQVAQVRRAGGLCVVAHPYAPYPSGTFDHPFDEFDLVEVWNGQWTSDLPWNADNEAALADWGNGLSADLHSGRWRPAIGNSDTHLAGQIALPHSVVLASELSTAAVLTGLRAGRSWIAGAVTTALSLTVSAGRRSVGIGGRLTAAGSPVMARLSVSGVPGGVVTFHTAYGTPHRCSLPESGSGLVQCEVADAGFVRVEVRHPDGRMAALTNPVILTR
jgi:hypothetical protein